jgi:hypothetical protein
MTTLDSSLPSLLSAAADLLEGVGERPPLSVTCNIADTVLARVVVTPSLARWCQARSQWAFDLSGLKLMP